MIRMYRCDNGELICELQAHSRQINGLVCHPSRSVFATAGEDTFMNVWEVAGSKIDSLEINLVASTRCPDFLLTGLAFGGNNNTSIVASVYDYKSVLVWDSAL